MLKFDDLVFGNSVNDFDRIDSGVKARNISPEEPSINIFKVGIGIGIGTGGDFDPTKDIRMIDPDEPSTDDDDNESPAPSEPTSPSTPSTPKTGGGTETPVDNNAGDDKDKNTEDMPIVPEPANPSAPGSTGNSGCEDETAPADDDKKEDETSIPNEPAAPTTSGNNGARKKTPIIENIAPEELDKKENIGNNIIVVESLKTHRKELVDTDAQVAAMMFGGNTALQKGFMRESLVAEECGCEVVNKKAKTWEKIHSLMLEISRDNFQKQKVIVLDPGHGGTSSGAAFGNLVEKDINLSITKKVANKLKDSEYDVVLTRVFDNSVDLKTRYTLANDLDTDLFVSIHTNSINPFKSGMSIIVPKKNPQNFAGMMAAKKIMKYAVETHLPIYTDQKAIKTDDRGLAVLNGCNKTSALVEVAYIYSDRKLLDTQEGLDSIASAIANGIIEYFGDNK